MESVGVVPSSWECLFNILFLEVIQNSGMKRTGPFYETII